MTNGNRLKVLVVDDTVIYRQVISNILSQWPDVEVVGTANNGRIALSKIDALKPDLLTLDIEMPEMDGLEVLRCLKKDWPDVEAIVLSSLTQKGGEMTIKALELGAFDFIPKPQTTSLEDSKKEITNNLLPMLKAYRRHREIRAVLKGNSAAGSATARQIRPESDQKTDSAASVIDKRLFKSDVVGIGISTGGPSALSQMMPRLPKDLNAPVLIVQHMPPLFTKSLASSLKAKCAIDVREACEGDTVLPNVAYIAPGGKQMKVALHADGKTKVIRITDDPPENSCKPSVDYLFRSIAFLYKDRSTGVIMTGMGADGVKGLKLMKRNGSRIIAQSEASCVVYGMPKEAVDAGVVDVVSPLDCIAEEIVRTVR